MISLPDLPSVHDRFLTLSRIGREQFQDQLRGKLLLQAPFDAPGVANVLAATIAGASSLCLDSDPGRLRDGLRSGLCDFVVGNLDEALRILKNEIRRGLAVSVGLGADEETCLAAVIERGVQPDLLDLSACCPGNQGRIQLERGAVPLPEHEQPAPGTSLVLWTLSTAAGRVLPRIAEMASSLLDVSRPDTSDRQRWLAGASRTLGRAFAGRQCLRMSDTEIETFLPHLRAKFPAAEVSLDGQPLAH